MKTSLDQSFFARPVLEVAPDLLGKFLVIKQKRIESAYMITEVEAYDGPDDLACHASKGNTPRTEVMFGAAGIWYVYLIYGMYSMLNVVTGTEGYPAAVLIRAVEGFDGPGKLTKHLGITRDYNKLPAVPSTGLWIEDRGITVEASMIVTTPRIGVAYAGEWAKKPWRFLMP
ncbi:MAG TPA: DNA-3-methyladenine glycosylase [Candidatus Paceibacterota bacterium]